MKFILQKKKKIDAQHIRFDKSTFMKIYGNDKLVLVAFIRCTKFIYIYKSYFSNTFICLNMYIYSEIKANTPCFKCLKQFFRYDS